MGEGGRAFVEVSQVGKHTDSDPFRGRRLVVKIVLQALLNYPNPAGLECGSAAVSFRIRHARPFRVRARDAGAALLWRHPVRDDMLPRELSVCDGGTFTPVQEFSVVINACKDAAATQRY